MLIFQLIALESITPLPGEGMLRRNAIFSAISCKRFQRMCGQVGEISAQWNESGGKRFTKENIQIAKSQYTGSLTV